jgi:hypothetical protein
MKISEIPLQPGVEQISIGDKVYNAFELFKCRLEGGEPRGFDGSGNPYEDMSLEKIVDEFNVFELDTVLDRLNDLAENSATEWFYEGTDFSKFKEIITDKLDESNIGQEDLTNP